MAEKSLVLKVTSSVGAATSGLKQVGQGIADMFTGGQGAAEKIARGSAIAVRGLSDALKALAPVARELIGAAEFAIKTIQFAGERQRLLGEVGTKTLDMMRGATSGLVTDQEILRASAKAMQGDFALTAEQLRIAGEAAVVLHSKGLGPTAEILERITDAMHRGEAEALKPYGISVVGVKTKSEQLAVAWDKLRDVGGDLDAQFRTMRNSGDNLQRTMVGVKNTTDTWKTDLAETYGFFKPLGQIFEGGFYRSAWNNEQYGSLANSIKGVMKSARDFQEEQRRVAEGMRLISAGTVKLNPELAVMAKGFVSVGQAVQSATDTLKPFLTVARDLADEDVLKDLFEKAKQAEEAKRDAAREGARRRRAEAEEERREQEQMVAWAQDFQWKMVETSAAAFEARGREMVDALQEQIVAFKEQSEEAAEHAARVFKKHFGDMDKTLTRQTNALLKGKAGKAAGFWGPLVDGGERFRETLGGVRDSAASAFYELISGQESAYASMGAFTSAMLNTLGQELQIEAFKALGMALRDSFWHPSAAASEWAAFGVFQAGAIAAGVGAAAIGDGGGGGGGGGGGSRGGSAGGTPGPGLYDSGGDGGESTTVVNNYYFGYTVGTERDVTNAIDRVVRKGAVQGARRGKPGASRPRAPKWTYSRSH